MDSTPEPTDAVASVHAPKIKKHSKLHIMLAIVGLVLLAGTAYGVYAWQQSKVNLANSKADALEKYAAELSKAAIALQAQKDQLEATKGATGAVPSVVSDDDAILQAANDFCNAQVSSDNAVAPKQLKVGTTGSKQVKIAYAPDKLFAAMNVNCHDASDKELVGGVQYILKKVNAHWLVITQGQDEDPVAQKLYGYKTFGS